MWLKSSFRTRAVAAISFCLIGGTIPAAAVFLMVASGTAKAGGPEFYYLDGGNFPWNSSDYATTMNMNFGAGNWVNENYQTVNVGQLLSGNTSFIYMEGGDDSANALNTFLGANLPGLQDWVAAGGTLFLNAAPNEGGNIDFGFGGVLLTYPDPGDEAHAVDPNHPIFNGPFGIVATDYTGFSFSHATVAGTSVSSMMNNEAGNSVLAELSFGVGGVVFGGMTAPMFHQPQPDSINLHANIIAYTTTMPPGKCPWDLDGNAVVGVSDLLSLLASWGPCKGCPADFDGNDDVGVSDLLALLANWGPCP